MTKTAPAAKANDVKAPAGKLPNAMMDAVQNRMAQRFSQVIAVMMRDPVFKKLRIEDLQWLVLPPVLNGQFKLAHATKPGEKVEADEGGVAYPVSAVLWARVSDALDKQMSETVDKQYRLKAADWTSGNNIWLIATIGDQRVMGHFLKQLHEAEFKGKTVKMRYREKDGKMVVKALGDMLPTA